MSSFVLFLPTFALVGGAVILLLADLLPYAWVKGWVAVGATGASLASVLFLVRYPWPMQNTLFVWQPAAENLASVEFSYYLDAFSFLLLVSALFAALALMLYATHYVAVEPKRQLVFYFASLMAAAAFVNLILSGNLLVAYLGLQIWILASFAVMAFWQSGLATASAVARSFVLASLPSTAVLLAVSNLASRNPSLAFADISPQSVAPPLLFVFLLAAAAVAHQYPFHPWIAVHFRLPLPAAALLGMVFSPWIGVYLLGRFHALAGPQIETLWHQSLMVVGALTMVAGAVYALKQTHLRGIAIFLATAQFGYAFLGLGINTPASIAAALLTLISGTLALSGMMICAGRVERSTGTGNVLKLGGLVHRMPRTTALFAVFAISLAGVPFPSLGFFSKWMILGAAVDAEHTAFGILTLVVDVLMFVMLMRTMDWVFFRRHYRLALEGDERSRLSLLSAGLLAAPLLVFGVLPFLLIDRAIKPALSLIVHVPASDLVVSLAGGFAKAGFWASALTFVLMLIPPLLGLIAYTIALGNDAARLEHGRQPGLALANDGVRPQAAVPQNRTALFPWVINTSGAHSAGWWVIGGVARALRVVLSPTEGSFSSMALLLAALTVLLALLE